MLNIPQLQSFLSDQRNLIVDLNISVENLLRLTSDKYEYERQIKEHGFFKHHLYQLKFILIIQLSKLFSTKKTEERSFYKLCNKLETSDYAADLRSLMETNKSRTTDEIKSKDDILKLVKEVRLLLNAQTELIQKIVTLRDQVYAHIDNNPKIHFISLDEIKGLVQLASNIHNLIRFRIFFTQTRFDDITDWDIDPVLYYMSELIKYDLEELKRKKNNLPNDEV